MSDFMFHNFRPLTWKKIGVEKKVFNFDFGSIYLFTITKI